MFEYKKVIITKRGENILEWIQRNDGQPRVDFTVHSFEVSSDEEIKEIISRPEFAEWKYGISIGLSRF